MALSAVARPVSSANTAAQQTRPDHRVDVLEVLPVDDIVCRQERYRESNEVCWSDPEVPFAHSGESVGSVNCVSGYSCSWPPGDLVLCCAVRCLFRDSTLPERRPNGYCSPCRFNFADR